MSSAPLPGQDSLVRSYRLRVEHPCQIGQRGDDREVTTTILREALMTLPRIGLDVPDKRTAATAVDSIMRAE
jgi:hypothetical protein